MQGRENPPAGVSVLPVQWVELAMVGKLRRLLYTGVIMCPLTLECYCDSITSVMGSDWAFAGMTNRERRENRRQCRYCERRNEDKG